MRPICNLVVLIFAFWIPFIASLSTYKLTSAKLGTRLAYIWRLAPNFADIFRATSNRSKYFYSRTLHLFTVFGGGGGFCLSISSPACGSPFAVAIRKYSKHCKYILLMPFHSPFMCAAFRFVRLGPYPWIAIYSKSYWSVCMSMNEQTAKDQQQMNVIKCSWDEMERKKTNAHRLVYYPSWVENSWIETHTPHHHSGQNICKFTTLQPLPAPSTIPFLIISHCSHTGTVERIALISTYTQYIYPYLNNLIQQIIIGKSLQEFNIQ